MAPEEAYIIWFLSLALQVQFQVFVDVDGDISTLTTYLDNM